MSRRLTVRPEAEAELADAALWYEEQRVGVGADLLAEVRSRIDVVLTRPESFPVVHRTVRRALTRRFPYSIYFVARPNLIAVIAIVHTSRDHDALLRDRTSQ